MHELELINEENYFFDFSDYLAEIELYIRTAVCSSNRKPLLSEIDAYRQNPKLAKLCISRPNQRMIVSPEQPNIVWGVPVPGEESTHQMYVWFEERDLIFVELTQSRRVKN